MKIRPYLFCLSLILTGCTLGPNPVVVETQEKSGGPGLSYVVTVRNQNSGNGQIVVRIKLWEQDPKLLLAQQEQTAELGAKETIRVTFSFPQLTSLGYHYRVEVKYPPD